MKAVILIATDFPVCGFSSFSASFYSMVGVKTVAGQHEEVDTMLDLCFNRMLVRMCGGPAGKIHLLLSDQRGSIVESVREVSGLCACH